MRGGVEVTEYNTPALCVCVTHAESLLAWEHWQCDASQMNLKWTTHAQAMDVKATRKSYILTAQYVRIYIAEIGNTTRLLVRGTRW